MKDNFPCRIIYETFYTVFSLILTEFELIYVLYKSINQMFHGVSCKRFQSLSLIIIYTEYIFEVERVNAFFFGFSLFIKALQYDCTSLSCSYWYMIGTWGFIRKKKNHLVVAIDN